MPRQRLRYPGLPGQPIRLALVTLLAASAPLTHATEAKETPRMNASAAHVTAEQAMHGMLELIRATPSVAELTPETMGERLGLPIKRLSTDHFGYAQPLAGGWAFSVERQQVGTVGPRVDLIFSPVGEDRPPATPICTPDFGHFTQELERMGFKRQSAHGEHGRWTYDAFDRPGQHVEVYPLVAEGAGATSACVHMVLVR
jgi:hypothetical protein